MTVLENLTETSWRDLKERTSLEDTCQQSTFAQLKAGIIDLLDGVTDRQYDSGIVEADHHIAVETTAQIPQGPQTTRGIGQIVLRERGDRETLLEHTQGRAGTSSAKSVQLRSSISAKIFCMQFDQGSKRRNDVEGLQINESTGREERDLVGVFRSEGGEGGLGSIIFTQTNELIETTKG